mmetsp:Transcript_21547/g.36938  ORF Transcript_21547/g.36938 Transcript_21547/m.36938 type:complete len:331 (-) Transcript_21547:81-1073(-)
MWTGTQTLSVIPGRTIKLCLCMAMELPLLWHTIRVMLPTLPVSEVHLVPLDVTDSHHGLPKPSGHLRQNFWVVVVGHSLHNSASALGRVARLEDTRPHKHTIHSQLHHQSSICRGGHATSSKVHNRQLACLRHLLDQVIGRLHFLCSHKQLVFIHGCEFPDLCHHCASVANSLHHITSTSLALGAEHSSTFSNSSEGLTQVPATTYKRHIELVLVNVVFFVGHGKHLTLINVICLNCLQDLSFHEVANAGFGHDGDAHCLFNSFDHLGVRHARTSAIVTDISRDPFKGHDGASSSLLGDSGLLGGDHVHNHTTLEHLGKACLHPERTLLP